MCEQDCCCKGCCHGSTCNKVLRAFAFVLNILAFCIHCAALGHTEWMYVKNKSFFGISLVRRSLFHEFGTSLTPEYNDRGYLAACWAFAALAAGSSFLAFIFVAIRMCKIKKGCEICALFFLFGAFGCEFLVWVIYLALSLDDTTKVDKYGNTWAFGAGFNCSICSMVFSFIVFVMTAVSVKMSGCRPIVHKEKVGQVVVVQAQPGQVVVGGNQPQYVTQPGYVEQQPPPAYGEKQPVY